MRAIRNLAVMAVAATAVMVLAGGALAGPEAQRRAGVHPSTIGYGLDGDFARATTGSYCVHGAHVGFCADSAYPLPIRRRVAVTRGDRVVLRMHDDRIASMQVTLLKVRRPQISPVRPVEDVHVSRRTPRVWIIHLPTDLGARSNVLDIFATYANGGDVNYWAGIDVVEPDPSARGERVRR